MDNKQANANRCRLMALRGLWRHQIGGADYSPTQGVMAGCAVYRAPCVARQLAHHLQRWGYSVTVEETVERYAPSWEHGHRVTWSRPGRLPWR